MHRLFGSRKAGQNRPVSMIELKTELDFHEDRQGNRMLSKLRRRMARSLIQLHVYAVQGGA